MKGDRTETADRVRLDFEDLMAGRDSARRTDGGEARAEAETGSRTAHRDRCIEWCPICRGAEVLRHAVPPEMQESWEALQREALLAARALLDRYIERQERERDRSSPLVDIPIE